MIKLSDNSPLARGQTLVRNGYRPLCPRTIREFAEQEVVPATGQYKDEPFRCSRQPFTGLLFDEIDRDYWQTIVISGPSQSSKTLSGLVIPTLYQSCELNETTVLGIPEADMADDKWQNDFSKIMQNSPRLRKYLPTRGSGSQKGKIKDSVELSHGVFIKIMTRGGQDTAKAGFTTRFVNITEAAGFSHASEASEEADTLRQLKARQRGFRRERRRMIIEGTLTIASELPWRLKGNDEDKPISTMSRLVTPCPHCGGWISPERCDFTGWQEAGSELEAAETASFYCPLCGEQLTEEERVASNADIRLLHAGQSIGDNGDVIGAAPRTTTLWFHWSQWHNLLTPAEDVAVDEWQALQLEPESADHRNAEKELCQFVWSTPYEPPEVEEIPLTREDVVGRAHEFPRSQLPEGTNHLGLGVDIRSSQIHYCVIAFVADGSGVAIDFDIIPVHHRKLGLRRALLSGLRTLRDKRMAVGYGGKVPKFGFIDSGWKPDIVCEFIKESRKLGFAKWYPSLGRGQSASYRHGGYKQPDKLSKVIHYIGDQYYLHYRVKDGLQGATVNADEWKSRLHEALATPVSQPGALRLYEPTSESEVKEVRRAGLHVTNEKPISKVVPDRGVVRVFVNHGQCVNHYLDAFYNALCAGHLSGSRVADTTRKTVPKRARQPAQKNRIASRFSQGTGPYMTFQRKD